MQVFWRKKILHYVGFFPSKVTVYAWFLARLCSKAQNFFSFLATLHSQKIVKEIAYILTSYQALLKAQFFCILLLIQIVCVINFT